MEQKNQSSRYRSLLPTLLKSQYQKLSNQEQKSKNFWDDFQRLIPKLAEASLERGIVQLDVDIVRRIWEAKFDADGNKFKRGLPYSERHAAFRLKKGRQIDIIDLSITSELRQSVTKVKTTTGQAIVFDTGTQAEKAREIEDLPKWKQKIFFASDKEAETALDLITDFFLTGIDELNKRYSQSA